MNATFVVAVYTSFVEPGLIDHSRFDYRYSEDVLSSYDIWMSNVDTENYIRIPSNLTLTTEETTQIAALYSDIETRATEIMLQVIMSSMTLEDWDNCVNDLFDLGLQECIDIVQAAMDRYNSK